MTQLLADQRLAGYRILGALGRGGMAAVYRAYEAELDREVALKVLPAELMEQSGFAERFSREARLIAKLEHPNIVPVYASGVDQGVPWMALRLVTGGTLQDYLEKGNLDHRQGLQLFQQIAKALDYAHRHGVLHRDLKPQNVLVSADHEVYLADFGIARLMAGSTALTGTGSILGTPHYMAPEQAQGEKLGPPCDIYAFAVILYRWLCGAVPFDADTPLAVLMQHVQAPIPLAPMHAIPKPAQVILLKGLAKDPAARWESATAMVAALTQALGAGTTVQSRTAATASAKPTPTLPAATPELTTQGSTRSTGRTVSLAAFALALVLAGAWAAYRWQADRPVDQTVVAASAQVPEPPTIDSSNSVPASSLLPAQSEKANQAVDGPAQLANREQVSQVQERLNALGYTVEPSAKLDQATLDAIERFGFDQGLPAGTSVNAALLSALDNELTRSELAAWQKALSDNSPEAYKTYAQAYPAGRFRNQVDAALAALESARQPAPTAPTQAPAPEPAVTDAQSGSLPGSQVMDRELAQVDTVGLARERESAAAEALAAETAARIADVQTELVRLNRLSAVDGRLNADTAAAIAEFEQRKGLSASGEVNDVLISGLRASQQWPDPRPGGRFRDCPACPEMVVIPGGEFRMGSPDDEPQRQPTEGPQRQVSVAAFALASTEVTFAQWDACLADGGCNHRPADQGWGGGQRPVVDVSWNDAQEYLAWLRRTSGQDYQLPSEAQWEYAARGGTRTLVYAGNCIGSDQANYNAAFPADGCAAGQFRQQTVAVASFAANPYGLHDVHGNVWEWVQDCWNDSYRGAPDNDQPSTSGNCANGTVRGGGWHDWGFWLRAASRYSFPRQSRHPYGGFRPARAVVQ